MKPMVLAATFSLALGIAGAAGAEVTERLNSGTLSFSGGGGYTNASLEITGPNGFSVEETAETGLPVFRVQTAGRLVDGFYRYSLTAASPEKVAIDTSVNNGRGEGARDFALKPFSTSGSFQIADGLIVVAPEARTGSDTDPVVEN